MTAMPAVALPYGRQPFDPQPFDLKPFNPEPFNPDPFDPEIRRLRAHRPDREERPPLRLTRRGRVVVATVSALLVTAFSFLAAGAAQATNHSAHQRHVARVVVRPGQSLWSVAESADPNQDTRLVIQQILELNSLTGGTVYAGEQLWVPRG